jgi:hypothetical protein
VQVVFALNEELTMNEKKSLIATRAFTRAPKDFADRTTAILAAPGHDEHSLRQSFDAMRTLITETRALSPELAYAWEG